MPSFEATAAIFGAILIVGALVSGLAERSFLSLTALFVLAGFAFGGGGLGWIDFTAQSGFVTDLAFVALIVILFRDGLEVEGEMLQRAWRVPLRKLVLAMPITAVIAAASAHLIFGLTWTESLLLGCLLSPTDPVLTSSIVTNPRVPRLMRHSLNLESGLNDGLALPAVLAFAAALSSTAHHFVWWRFVLQDVGLGFLFGIACGLVASVLLPRQPALSAPGAGAHGESGKTDDSGGAGTAGDIGGAGEGGTADDIGGTGTTGDSGGASNGNTIGESAGAAATHGAADGTAAPGARRWSRRVWGAPSSRRRRLVHGIPAHHKSLYGLGVAFATYGVTVLSPHGNGFIAVFVTAIVLGVRRPDIVSDFEHGAAEIVELVKLGIFLVFGSLLTVDALTREGPAVVAFVAILFLLARPVAVWVSLIGTATDRVTRLFMGWFGPRGVASMTFSLLILDKQIRSGPRIFDLAAFVVLCSIVIHGATDTPGANWMARREERRAAQRRARSQLAAGPP